MKLFVILIFLTFLYITTPQSLRRINNGKPATPGMFPYIVGITHSFKTRHCGGGILTDRWVISARHCFKRGKQYAITIGMDSSNIITIHEILFYDGVETSVKKHDIALLKTQKRIPIDGKFVTPLELPSLDQFFGGTIATLAGYGRKGDTLGLSDIKNKNFLQFMDTHVLHNDESQCENKPEMMCVKGMLEGAVTCPGDSGSPLVLKGTKIIIGVLYGGFEKCEQTNATSMLARITYYADWIEEQTGLKFMKSKSPNYIQRFVL